MKVVRITWFIGNGFDVNIGLKTSYSDFRKRVYFSEKHCDSPLKDKLIEKLVAADIKDFFLASFGRISKNFWGGRPVSTPMKRFQTFPLHSRRWRLSLWIMLIGRNLVCPISCPPNVWKSSRILSPVSTPEWRRAIGGFSGSATGLRIVPIDSSR